ncbi:unnamed protein product [Rotaria magnacalcarata]|uniref:Uncharacterized protein n=1 Tax=Rotaria magnacalcarata TaxID=392030 RepID=A0A816BVX2_9BILA|nr:unnamed protein product [Rotaria magnacalcarata]
MTSSVFRTIKPKDIWLGDHLYVSQSKYRQHHGIVLFVNSCEPEQSIILEFNTNPIDDGNSKANIQKVTLKQFQGSYALKKIYIRFKID